MLYGGGDIARSAFGILPDSTVLRPDEFWAIEDVTFELKQGESFGIIGPNGSGKTTVLKMLNGIFMPDKGRITVKGKMGALIQIGAGFHPMLSGRENIYINAAILGMKKKEIDTKFDSIVEFADIGDFLDSPVKFYSSGMYVRLGFAVAIHCRPDILLIDEILAVGDIKFQSKCLKYITENILKNGCSVIFVSHNRYAVQDVCKQALYLNKGKTVELGPVQDVIGHYLADIKDEENKSRGKEFDLFSTEEILKVVFLDQKGQEKTQFHSGESIRIIFYYSFSQTIQNPSVAITFIHDDPRYSLVANSDYLFNLHSGYDGLQIKDLQGRGYFEVTVDALYLPVGIYKYFIYLYSDNSMNLVRKYEDAGHVEMLWGADSPKRSLVELPHRWVNRQEGAV